MSSAADLLPVALIVLGVLGLWRGRAAVPPLLRAAGRWPWNACRAAPRLLGNVLVGSEALPRPRRAWQKPRVRITWVARAALYPVLVAALMWQWHGRSGLAIYAADLEVEASAPRDVAPGAPLPLRVATSALGGGAVRTDVHWRTVDGRGTSLAAGAIVCDGAMTIPLPAAERVRTVELVARGAKGEQTLRLDRATADRARSRSADRAHALVKTAERQQHVVWMVARLGLVLVGLWLVAEAGAWLARRALRAGATLSRQAIVGALVLLPVSGHLWTLAEVREVIHSPIPIPEPSSFVRFLQVARAGIECNRGFFSWSWWLPLEVDPRR